MKGLFFALTLSCQVLLVAILGLGPLDVYAQVDPSSALLLRSRASTPTKDEFDSGRYSVKPGYPRDEDISVRIIPTQPASVTDIPKVVTEPEAKPPTKVEVTPLQTPVEDQSEVAVETDDNKTLINNLRQLLLGGSSAQVESYLGQVEPSDPRNNLIELTLSPFIFYNDSSSSFYYRNYNSSGLGLGLGAKLWLSPFFGLSTLYQKSFNADMKGAPESADREPVDHEWFEAELKFRNYFGLSRRAPSLTFGLGYTEYEMEPHADATSRYAIKSSGVKLSLESSIATSRGTAWLMGLEIMPRLTMKETSSQITARSGRHAQTNALGVSLGRRYVFDRSNVLFWKLQHTFEKSSYKDQATEPDPLGVQPTNVSVTNTRSMLIFGFTWGR